VGLRIAIAQFDGATVLRVPPLAAGLLASTIRAAPDLGDVAVQVYAARRPLDDVARSLAEADLVGVSLYTWNARYALEVARRAKALRPDLVVVAGGPSVPRRPLERDEFLSANSWIDALVLGEGELALTDIVRAMRAGSPLGAIAGVIPARPRLAGDEFAAIGSPYLDGTFDELAARGEIAPISAAVLETNRGCPFACSFCDWGQATQSKVLELPLARIERELAWMADRGISYLYLIDANFGIRRRDADITTAIGRLSRERGAPRFVFFHLTKNATEKNLRTIEILREHGVGTQVALSMQDFDPEVLLAIRRDNIPPVHALALRRRCHEQGMSTTNELMLGLPAQTAASIRRSIVAALTPFPGDTFFLYATRVLENTELAEPDYRARYGIETRDVPQWPSDPSDKLHVVEHEKLVVATASLPSDEWRSAYTFGCALSALWNQRLLQTTLHVLQFALSADAASYVDALLASDRPRLSAIRAELDRFARAILDAEGSTLPIAGWGDWRREPAEAVCARVFDDAAAFYADAAEEAARLVGAERATLIREAVAWDALRTPSIVAAPSTARFQHDWLDYEARMGASPQPTARPIVVRVTPALFPGDATARHVALDWLKRARNDIEKLAPLPLVPTVPSAAQLRERAAEDGFVYLPSVLPVERLAPLRALVDAALASRGWLVDGRSDPSLRLGRWDDPRWHQFLGVVLASEPYRQLAAAPELLDVLRPILDGEPLLHVGDVCRLVSPGAIDLTTPPHQDAAYLADATGVWTAWIPLGPCPLALGPLALLAGSHRGGLRAHAPVRKDSDGVIGADVASDAPWRSLDLNAGDVILFSSMTLHCALPNTTADQLRVSVDFRYRRA
jgi:radical SAM superfamily enzyme YgiQ (UPF0313 family)